MPTITCSYCEYVGSGATYSQQLNDVVSHEEVCEYKKALEQGKEIEHGDFNE